MQRRVPCRGSHAARTDIGGGAGSFWVAGIFLVALAACTAQANTRSVPPSESPMITSSPTVTSSPTESPVPTCNEPAQTTIHLVVRYFHFNVRCLVVPAGDRLTVTFENKDLGANHNFSIYTLGSEAAFTGDVAYPQESFSYTVPALEAGEYLFQCDVHPRDMSGLLLVK
jgi:plastocyanin